MRMKKHTVNALSGIYGVSYMEASVICPDEIQTTADAEIFKENPTQP